MKKILFSGLFLLMSFTLLGCDKTKTNSSSVSTTQYTTEVVTSTSEKETNGFTNGILTSNEFILKIKQEQVIKSPYYEDFGLFITFDLTNNSDVAIIPDEVLTDHIIMKQKNDTSVVELDNYYDFENSFGDDIDTYNEQVEKYNSMSNELLPGKTVEIYGAFTLDNLDHPVEIITLVDGETFDGYEIEVSDLTKSVETVSEFEETEIINSLESQVATTPSSQAAVSDMPPSWREGEYEWEKAKSEGWTAEDWEAAVKASENETYVIENSTGKYYQAIDEGATPYQAEMYATGVAENWKDVPIEKSVPDVDYGPYDSDGFSFPQGTSEEAAQLYKDIVNRNQPLTAEELKILDDIENGTYE